MQKRNKDIFLLSLRFLIAAIIIYILTKGNKKLIIQTIQSIQPSWLVAALSCFFISFCICIIRWNILLNMQEVKLKLSETFNLGMQGMFFSLVIPGAVGGDLAKAGLISSVAAEGSKIKAIFSILVDRIIGLIGLFLLTALLGIVSFKQISTMGDIAKLIIIFLIAGSVMAIIGSSMLFLHRTLEKFPIINTMIRITDKYSKGSLTHIMHALDGYKQSYAKLIFWIIISAFLVHLPQGLAVYCITRGTGEEGQKAQYVILSAAMANAVGAIPLTPSGLGTRDVVISTMLSASGLSKEKALSIAILNTGLILAFNLSGGIFFILGTKKKQRKEIFDKINSGENPENLKNKK